MTPPRLGLSYKGRKRLRTVPTVERVSMWVDDLDAESPATIEDARRFLAAFQPPLLRRYQ